MRSIFTILILLFATSCTQLKEEKTFDSVDMHNLQISVGLKTSVSDEFQIVIKDFIIDETTTKTIQFKKQIDDTINFVGIYSNFGETPIPSGITITLGNDNVKKIELNGIEVRYGSLSILTTPKTLNRFFRTNKYLNYDRNTQSFKTMEINGVHRPAFIATKRLLDTIKMYAIEGNYR